MVSSDSACSIWHASSYGALVNANAEAPWVRNARSIPNDDPHTADPISRTRLGEHDLAVMRLLDHALRLQRGDGLVDRRLGDVETLGDVHGTDAGLLAALALDADDTLQIILVRHREVGLTGAFFCVHRVSLL